MGDPTGYGLHGDFINGWTDQTALQNAFPSCVGPDGVKCADVRAGCQWESRLGQ